MPVWVSAANQRWKHPSYTGKPARRRRCIDYPVTKFGMSERLGDHAENDEPLLQIQGQGRGRLAHLLEGAPAALPKCFVGFKCAAVNATVFAGICFLTAFGLALFGRVTLAERLLIPWHISVHRH